VLAILDFADSPDVFITPKPVKLIRRIIHLATGPDAIVLDSFAGSGTTAQAVLEANAEDGGTRRFILVECEAYADSLTAERVRRVMAGYAFKGVQHKELLREKLSFSSLKKAGALLGRVQSVDDLQGADFDAIKKEIRDGELVVSGETRITENVAGLGGAFAFCTLGEALDLEAMLGGRQLPTFETIGAWLFHTATGQVLDPAAIDPAREYLGRSADGHVWLIYRPELDFLKSPAAALTLEKAEALAKAHGGQAHLVFAAAKFVANADLARLKVSFAPLPFALYRLT